MEHSRPRLCAQRDAPQRRAAVLHWQVIRLTTRPPYALERGTRPFVARTLVRLLSGFVARTLVRFFSRESFGAQSRTCGTHCEPEGARPARPATALSASRRARGEPPALRLGTQQAARYERADPAFGSSLLPTNAPGHDFGVAIGLLDRGRGVLSAQVGVGQHIEFA